MLVVPVVQENNEGYDGSCSPGSVLGKQSVYVLSSQGTGGQAEAGFQLFVVI